MPSEGELRFWTNVLPSELTIHCFPWVPVPSVNGPNGATLKQSKSSIEHWTIGNFPNLLHFVCFANLYFFLLFSATTVFSILIYQSFFPVLFSHYFYKSNQNFCSLLLSIFCWTPNSVLLVVSSFCCSMFQALFDCWDIFIFFFI